jgi:subtilisin family serine protease
MPTPDPRADYVRVVAVLEADGWMADAAEALRDGRPLSEDLQGRMLHGKFPAGFIVDPTFYSVPLGLDKTFAPINDPAALKAILPFLEPRQSAFFAVRGFVRTNPDGSPKDLGDTPIYSDPAIGEQLIPGTHPAVGHIGDVRQKLGIATLAANGLDGAGVGVAIVDSGIFLEHLTRPLMPGSKLTTAPLDSTLLPRCAHPLPAMPHFNEAYSWLPGPVATPPGAHRIGHGTMVAYDVMAVAPKATLLDYPILIARAAGDHTARGTASAALMAYGRLLLIWALPRFLGQPLPFNRLVINNSWGIFHPCLEDFPPGHPYRFIDNPGHPLRFLIALLAAGGADILFSAGNGGAPHPTPPFLHLTTGTIRGAAAYGEVLTVAGCIVKDVKDKAGVVTAKADERTGYSSQGPSIAGMPQEKPDLAAYTHFLGSQVPGKRAPDSGTSASCPIVSGCVAALRTRVDPDLVPPSTLFDTLRDTARKVPGQGPGWSPDYGHGIIDPVEAARRLLAIP